MEDNENVSEENQITIIDELNLEEAQLVDQLYNSAGLGPVVDAGLKDYNQRLMREDKIINKVFGPRGNDIKGYGVAVAKRVAFAVYEMLNKQYGGKVGDLRSYIMTLEEDRDHANARYDELLGRVVGTLGEDYKDLRADSREFMEKLTTVLGEDLKEAKIDKKELAESLADIDGLRSQIKTLTQEKEDQKNQYESQITTLQHEHNDEVKGLKGQIADLDARIKQLEADNAALTESLNQLTADYEQLRTAITALPEAISHDEIGKKLGQESYDFVLKDSKVPDKVIDGIGKFIDFRKYLAQASTSGAQEAVKQAKDNLTDMLR